MAWYLRKSFGIGPLRINLSKGGLGYSVGVKGARIGVKPSGETYVHGGRYGLYFRRTLGGGAASREEPDGSVTQAPAAAVDESVCWRCGKGRRTEAAVQFCPYCGARFDAPPSAHELTVPMPMVIALVVLVGILVLALSRTP